MPVNKKNNVDVVATLNKALESLKLLTKIVEEQDKRIAALEQRPVMTTQKVKELIYDHAPMVGVNDNNEETQQ